MKIQCIGTQWRGGNDGALFYSFSRNGHLIDILDDNYYINFNSKSLFTRIVDKVFRELYVKEFNDKIIEQFNKFKPDLVLVYKGRWVYPATLAYIKSKSVPLVNFFPDVSFFAHGGNIPKALPYFDLIFSTKTFAEKDIRETLNIKADIVFCPHGFDPILHRTFDTRYVETSPFKCDASFIGGYTPEKEMYLAKLVNELPGLDLKIWGNGWDSATAIDKKYMMKTAVMGDLYPLAIQSSTINLALLSEKVKGASSGDLITSRTFHIPASGGFMLHKRNAELAIYFKEGENVACYDNPEELLQKIKYYLDNPIERERIRLNGQNMVRENHSLDNRAEFIIKTLSEKNII